MDTWKFKLRPASFRGVLFKVSDDEATFGKRAVTHEYPLRDIPFTEDMGRKARRYSVSAYLIGNDYMHQRDLLLKAIEKPGPGTLIHPFYGSLNVNVDGDIKVHHSRDNGRMCEISLQFVEHGQLTYPTAGTDTAGAAKNAAKKASDSLMDKFLKKFHLDGVADWVQKNVIDNASAMMDEVISTFETVDSYVADAARVMQGDLSVLLPPPTQGYDIYTEAQEMWAAGESVYYDTGSAISAATSIINPSSGSSTPASTTSVVTESATDSAIKSADAMNSVVTNPAFAPKGIWSTDSETTKQTKELTNMFAEMLRETAMMQAVIIMSNIPSPPAFGFNDHSGEKTHQPIPDVPGANKEIKKQFLNYDQLMRQKNAFRKTFDVEANRITDDKVFINMNNLKQAVISDINKRLQQATKMITRKPDDVTPSVVLASDWYDDAARGAEIVALNNIPEPGFIPPEPLRVASE